MAMMLQKQEHPSRANASVATDRQIDRRAAATNLQQEVGHAELLRQGIYELQLLVALARLCHQHDAPIADLVGGDIDDIVDVHGLDVVPDTLAEAVIVERNVP